jgi:hypothetical protein
VYVLRQNCRAAGWRWDSTLLHCTVCLTYANPTSNKKDPFLPYKKCMKRESLLFLYYRFYDFYNKTKTVARPQLICSLRFSKNAYFSIDAGVFSTYVFKYFRVCIFITCCINYSASTLKNLPMAKIVKRGRQWCRN